MICPHCAHQLAIPIYRKTVNCKEIGPQERPAEARLGELLEKTEFDKGGRPSKTGSTDGTGSQLKDIGLTKQSSHRAQQLARHQELIPKVVGEKENAK